MLAESSCSKYFPFISAQRFQRLITSLEPQRHSFIFFPHFFFPLADTGLSGKNYLFRRASSTPEYLYIWDTLYIYINHTLCRDREKIPQDFHINNSKVPHSFSYERKKRIHASVVSKVAESSKVPFLPTFPSSSSPSPLPDHIRLLRRRDTMHF